MNSVFCFEMVLAGFMSGLLAWLFLPSGNPWNIAHDMQTALLAVGIFSGAFWGFVSLLQILFAERHIKKALTSSAVAATIGFLFTASGSVVFAILSDYLTKYSAISPQIARVLWWLYFSVLMSTSIWLIHGNVKIMCRTILGLTPAFLIIGPLIDKIYLHDHHEAIPFLLLGITIGTCYAIAWELLKESWLDENVSSSITFRFYIDDNEFSIGSAIDNDLTLLEGPENVCLITEKDGIHTVETQEVGSKITVNKTTIRHRTLLDGDVITFGHRSFVYHTKLSRSRDEIPAPAV